MVKRISSQDKDFINNVFENLIDNNKYTTSDLSKILGFQHESSLMRNRSFRKLRDEKVFRIDGATEHNENIYLYNKWKLVNVVLDDLEARSGEKIKGIIK